MTFADHLSRRGLGEVDTGARRRAEYSSDASNYRVVPVAVGFPRHEDEVLAALDVCRAEGVPLTLRGGGTSIAGNAVGPGLVLDLGRHLRGVTAVDPDTATATVRAGTILDDLQRAAAPHGLRFGPDPSSHARCTVGGMIGNNACGAHAVAYGRTSDNVVSLDVADGTGRRFTAAAGLAPVPGLADLVDRHRAVLRTELGRFSRQGSGYGLEHLLPENGAHLGRALVGTEGTCVAVLGATVRLVPVPAATALAVLGYPDMPTAADAVAPLLAARPLAVEGLDARLVDVIRTRRGPNAVPPLPRGGGWLFVEVGGEDPAAALAAAGAVAASMSALDTLTVPAGPEASALWRIREDGAGLAGRTPGGAPAWPGWEDAAVPPERLGDYLRDFAALLTEYRLDGLVYGHLGDGCVHVRIDLPLADDLARARAFLTAAAGLVAAAGGSLSGEHGDGRARGELLPVLFPAPVLDAFADVKRLFDPDDLLNPGVAVRPAPLDADLRVPAARPLRTPGGLALAADGGDLTRAVHRCVGVGKCRADVAGNVMCPSYLATRDEKDSTRGRARVLQELANGTLVTGWRSAEVRESLDLCLACKGCASDCPAGVDMASYKAEVLHQAYRRRVRPASHYALGWLPRWARVAAFAPGIANGLLRSPLGGLARRAAGVDARRELPAFASRTFRRTWRPSAPDGRPEVVLFADTFTDHFGPSVAGAAAMLLDRAGFAVRLPERAVCCGLTWTSTGQLDGARRRLRRTVDTLLPYAEAGLPIVGLEPSCTAALRSELPELLPGPAAERVAAGTRTLAELLTSAGWTPPRLDGVEVIAQPHCHHHAVLGWDTDRRLLESAGARVRVLDGCCGLAGNFGMERGHYEVSVAVAEHALLPALRAAGPDAVVLADGFSCRLQAEQLGGHRPLHLAELLLRGQV